MSLQKTIKRDKLLKTLVNKKRSSLDYVWKREYNHSYEGRLVIICKCHHLVQCLAEHPPQVAGP